MNKTYQLILEFIDDTDPEGKITYRHKTFNDLSPHVNIESIHEGVFALSRLYRHAVIGTIIKEQRSLIHKESR